jgi:ribosomal protein S7
MNGTTSAYARLTVNVPVEMKERVQLICARRQLTMREYLTKALEERLASDLASSSEGSSLLALTARADPVLAELWANEKDAAHDRL